MVIKVPRPALLEDPTFAGRFAREVRSLVKLSHPHIVKIQEVGEHAGLPYVVLQYLPGGSLRQRQRPGPDGQMLPMPAESLLGWLPDVAQALDFIHQQGYIHRDVKPDNILFDAHGNAYLSDFGIAKAMQGDSHERQTHLTRTGLLLGTAAYMASELLQGKRVDGRVDQYAFAVTVYEMLSGRVPYDGPTPVAVAMQQIQQPLPPLGRLVPGLPQELCQAVEKALAQDPQQRFENCAAFARAVLLAVHALPRRVNPSAGGPWPRRLARPWRRRWCSTDEWRARPAARP